MTREGPTIKVYSLGSRGYIRTPVRQALRLPGRTSIATVIVVAHNRPAGRRLLHEVHGPVPRPGDPQFAEADGPDVGALREAGMLGRGAAVYAHPRDGPGLVAQLLPGGDVRIVGELAAGPQGWVFTPVGLPRLGEYAEPMLLDQVAQLVAAQLEIGILEATELVRECALAIAEDPTRWDPEACHVLPHAIAELVAAAVDQHSGRTATRDAFLALVDDNRAKFAQVSAERELLRGQQRELAMRAIELNLVREMGRALGLTREQIYKLRDEALRAESARLRGLASRTAARFPAPGRPGELTPDAPSTE